MRTDIPSTVQQTAQDLAPDSLVSLYRLDLRDGTIIRFNPHYDLNWSGSVWNFIPCTLSEVGVDANGRSTRPKFSFVNPGGIFTSPIQQGYLDNAKLKRLRMLKADLDANNTSAYLIETYVVTKIMQMSKDLVVTECRDAFDGPLFKLPARAYYPPQFPHVNLR